MNREEILRMAREAGFTNVRGGLMDNGELSDYWDCWPNQLERFAALVAAAEREKCYEFIEILIDAEREACAQMVDSFAADAIRARGEG